MNIIKMSDMMPDSDNSGISIPFNAECVRLPYHSQERHGCTEAGGSMCPVSVWSDQTCMAPKTGKSAFNLLVYDLCTVKGTFLVHY